MRISDWSSDVCSSDLNIDRATDIDVGVFGFDPYLADRVDAELADERDIPDVGIIFLFAAEDTAGLIIDRHRGVAGVVRSEEHTSELQSLMRTSNAAVRLTRKKTG